MGRPRLYQDDAERQRACRERRREREAAARREREAGQEAIAPELAAQRRRDFNALLRLIGEGEASGAVAEGTAKRLRGLVYEIPELG